MTAIWILSVSALMCQMSITASLHWRREIHPRTRAGPPLFVFGLKVKRFEEHWSRSGSVSEVLEQEDQVCEALYPSAFRVKRGTPALLNPSFQKTVEDASLLYEVLLSGGFMDAAHGTLHVTDQELASMRRLDVLEVLCEDVLPRSLSEIQRLSVHLEQRRGSLRVEDFERTVLTLVFTAQQIQQSDRKLQRELWMSTLLRLYKAIKADLRPSHTTDRPP